jgi:hypothetical protein
MCIQPCNDAHTQIHTDARMRANTITPAVGSTHYESRAVPRCRINTHPCTSASRYTQKQLPKYNKMHTCKHVQGGTHHPRSSPWPVGNCRRGRQARQASASRLQTCGPRRHRKTKVSTTASMAEQQGKHSGTRERLVAQRGGTCCVAWCGGP